MLIPTDKGQPLNSDLFMASVQHEDMIVSGRAWIELGKWYFIGTSIGDTTVYQVDRENIFIIFGYPMKEPKYN